MTNLEDFIGTWRSERGAPYSTMTFIWSAGDEGPRGEWIIEAAAPPPGTATWMSNPRPRSLQMRLGPPTFEADRALFTINDGPYITEFRLIGDREAAVGAAVDKLPPEFSEPEYQRSIEGHRVRLTKVPDAK